MKFGNNLKIATKLYIGFLVMDAVLVFSLYTGYNAALEMSTLPAEMHPAHLSKFATLTAVEFILMIIVTAGIAVALVGAINKALKEVKRAADGLVAGKVDIQMKKYNNDELGMIIDDFQKVIDNVRYEAEIVKEVSEGNLTVEVTPRSNEDVMGHALKKLVEQNRHSIHNVRDAAHQVSTSASQVECASEALAQGSTEQASALEQITASIAEVAEKTKQNATQANEATQLMAQTIEDVKNGNVEMQQMMEAMQAINKASDSISKIIKVIDDIAFQTNILALNAAVEAARAGEAGKGFAVVAEEVRNLAAKSSEAAAETAEMIEDSIKKVAEGSKIADETAQALDEITLAVKKSESLITDIAEASNFQATAIAQLNQALEQVSQVVQTNSATSEECAAASQELTEQAARVKEMVAAYKLGD